MKHFTITWTDDADDLGLTFDADVFANTRDEAIRSFMDTHGDIIVAVNGRKVGPTTLFRVMRPKWKAAVRLGKYDENVNEIDDRADELVDLVLGHTALPATEVRDMAWGWVQR